MLSLKDFKKSSFSVFEGSELFNLNNVLGGIRYEMSSKNGRKIDTADATPGPGGQGPGGIESGISMSTGGKWDIIKWYG